MAKARPLFRGHYQPHVPADLGYYDLRLPEARAAQADLARQYGIEGFCYWHYWFSGKRLLERPFNEVLKSGEPDFPFCLGWANESWTGVWHGALDRILMEQTYPGRKDEEAHFNAVLQAFSDKRYMTVEGKPVFYIYNPHLLPDAAGFVGRWRELAAKSGLKGIYFIGEIVSLAWDPVHDGFDAAVPNNPGLGVHNLESQSPLGSVKERLRFINEKLSKRPSTYRYKDIIRHAFLDSKGGYDLYPSVVPNWDNTPRCGSRGYVLTDSAPELFRIHLREAISRVADREPDKRIVFVKSWNEWAEGNYLEPDMKFGRAYLEVCRDETFKQPQK